LFDGEEQKETGSKKHPGEYQVPEPGEETEVVLTLKNLHTKRVAVVLLVNGKNTLYGEDRLEESPDSLSRWILEPGVRYELRGFYRRNNREYDPFEVMSDEESLKEEELDPHPKLGSIELIVFVEGGGDEGMVAKKAGLRRALALKKRPKTAKEAVQLARKNADTSVQALGLIKRGTKTGQTDLKSTAFKNPQLQENRVIWYYDRKKEASSDK